MLLQGPLLHQTPAHTTCARCGCKAQPVASTAPLSHCPLQLAIHSTTHVQLTEPFPGGPDALAAEMFGARDFLNQTCGIPLEVRPCTAPSYSSLFLPA